MVVGRPQSTPGGRPLWVKVRLSQAEMDFIDEDRKAMGRSEYLRFLMVLRKRQKRAPNVGPQTPDVE